MPVDGAAAGGSLKLVGDFTYHSQVDFLGKGSFADVFRARHKELKGVVVAIKRVKKRQLTPRVRASLEQEIAILKLLKHPHIVQLYTTYDSTNHKYLVMEFCPDGDLAQYLKKQPNNRLPAPEIQRYLQQIADALEYLRERNIVHRDLKPQNLLLSSPLASSAAELVLARTQSSKAAARAGAGPSAAAAAAAASSSTTTTSADPFAATDSASLRLIKIADFGFARDLIGLDMADTVCGSPYYMAPEILESKPYDASADLWSLGVILFECFTGRRPFKANSYIELGNMIKRHGDSLAMPAEAPQHAQHLMKGLLRKDAKDRISFDAFFAHKFVDFESYKSRAGASPPVTPPREKTPPGTSATTTTTAATKTPERRVSPKISRPDVVAARRQPDDDDDDAGDDDVVEALATAMKEDTALVNVSQFDTLDEFAPLPTIKPFKDMSGSAFTAAATPPGTTTTAAAAATTTTIASTLPSTAIVAPSTLTQSGNAFASGSASGSVSGFVVIDRPAVVNAFADAVGNTRSPPVQSSSEKRGAGIALAAQVSSGPVDMCAASPNRGIISPVTPQNSPATYATSPSDLSSGQLVSSYQRQHQERIALQQQPQQQEYQRGAYGQVVRVLSSMATRLFGTSLHGDSSAATATGPAVSLASLIQQEQQESYFCRELNTCANRGRAVMHFAMERQLVAHGGDPAATSNTASAATTSIGGTGSTACSLSPSESFMTSPRLRMVCNAEALLLYTRALHVLYRGILYAQRCIQQPSADTSRPRSSSSVASSVSSSQSSTSYSSSPNPLMSSAGISVDTMPINVSPRVNDVVQVLRTLFNDCLDKADAIRSENAQLAKRLSLSVNGDIEVPSAEKMIYEHSLGLCRDGAVEELVGDLTEASTHYQRAKLMLEAIVMPTADGEQPPSLSREGIVAVQNALQGIGKRLWVLSLRTQGRRPSSTTVSGATP